MTPAWWLIVAEPLLERTLVFGVALLGEPPVRGRPGEQLPYLHSRRRGGQKEAERLCPLSGLLRASDLASPGQEVVRASADREAVAVDDDGQRARHPHDLAGLPEGAEVARGGR